LKIIGYYGFDDCGKYSFLLIHQRRGITKRTSFAVVGYGFEIDEMRADNRVYRVVVSQLDFDPLTKRREHFGENDLLVPHRRIAVFPYTRFALKPTNLRDHFIIHTQTRIDGYVQFRLVSKFPNIFNIIFVYIECV